MRFCFDDYTVCERWTVFCLALYVVCDFGLLILLVMPSFLLGGSLLISVVCIVKSCTLMD